MGVSIVSTIASVSVLFLVIYGVIFILIETGYLVYDNSLIFLIGIIAVLTYMIIFQ